MDDKAQKIDLDREQLRLKCKQLTAENERVCTRTLEQEKSIKELKSFLKQAEEDLQRANQREQSTLDAKEAEHKLEVEKLNGAIAEKQGEL